MRLKRVFACIAILSYLGSAPFIWSQAGAPAISNLTFGDGTTVMSSPSGPVGMGFIINGTNFGSSQGSSTVAIGGTSLAVLAWNPNGTSITVQIPAGALSGSVVVTVGGQASNAVSFVVSAPFGCN